MEVPSLIRSPHTLKIVIRSSRGDLRPMGINPMCAAARVRNGRCERDCFTTVAIGPYASSTNGNITVSSVLMWLARYTTGPSYALRLFHPSMITSVPYFSAFWSDTKQ